MRRPARPQKIKASVKEAQNLEPKRNVRLMFEDEVGFGLLLFTLFAASSLTDSQIL